MQRVIWILATVLGVSLLSSAVWAQDKVEYQKKTVIDLTGATIEGELTKPEGAYIVNRKLSEFSTLIQARGNFRDELLVSHNEL